MEQGDATRIMIILAVATPALAMLTRVVLGQALQHADEPMPRQVRRNIWLLACAGPGAALLWWLFDDYLSAIGSRSVAGYILAGLMFIAAGFVTGFFGRLRGRIKPSNEHPDEHPSE